MEAALCAILEDARLAAQIAGKARRLRLLDAKSLHKELKAEGITTMGLRARCSAVIEQGVLPEVAAPTSAPTSALGDRLRSLLAEAGLGQFSAELCPMAAELLALEGGRALQAQQYSM